MGELIRLFDVGPEPEPEPATRGASTPAGSTSPPDGPAARETPAAWLLREAVDGVPLTATFTLSRSVVRDAVARWPSWWDDRFGLANREGEVIPLKALRESLLRLRLVRRRGRELLTTKRGRDAAGDPDLLLATALPDLGGDDVFGSVALAGLLDALQDADGRSGPDAHEGVPIRQLLDAVAEHATQHHWRGPGGAAATAHDVTAIVREVIGRCEAYGLVTWPRTLVGERGARPDVRLTDDGRRVRVQIEEHGTARLALRATDAENTAALTFHAKLEGVPRVSARIVLRSDDDFVDLHRAIQDAFRWFDDHLYSFWLDGRFWGAADQALRTPGGDDFMDVDGERDADAVPLGDAGLVVGSTVAYVFDFGDEWRVRLTLKAIEPLRGGEQWGVVRRTGTAPPQYPGFDDE